MGLNIAFRVDASLLIGSGHVMRCLTLANVLRFNGSNCFFVCRPHTGHLIDTIKNCGFKVIILPVYANGVFSSINNVSHASWLGVDWYTDSMHTIEALKFLTIDWLVVDHYALDKSWEVELRRVTRNILVIDDLADRYHDCDLLLDQNLGRSVFHYNTLVSNGTLLLLGPNYSLLRPEFSIYRPESLARRSLPKFECLLVAMGGVDKDNITSKVLVALDDLHLPKDIKINVILGPQSPWIDSIKIQASSMSNSTIIWVDPDNIAYLLTISDLAIGAPGSSAWERCCLGLPSIQIVLADNQMHIARELAIRGIAATATIDALIDQLPQLPGFNGNLSDLTAMSYASRVICDGSGANVVASIILRWYSENYVTMQ